MKANDRALKRYYRDIRSWLPCSRKNEKRILEQIRSSVEGYLEQNPEADINRVQTEFGSPQTIAASYVENMGAAEILKDLRLRRRIFAAVASAVAIILLLWAGVVTWAGIRADQDYFKEKIAKPSLEHSEPESIGATISGKDESGLQIEFGFSATRLDGTRTGTKTYTYRSSSGDADWEAVLTGTFTYQDNTYICTSCNCTITVFNDTWYSVCTSTSQDGDTALAEFTMGYDVLGAAISERSFRLSLTCDKHGNMS